MLTVPITLAERIDELVAQHGSLRAAAAVLRTDAAYLWRLKSGEKNDPGEQLLRRMKLRRVVSYERIGKAASGMNSVASVGAKGGDGVALPGPVVTDIPNEAWGAPYSTSATNDARATGVKGDSHG
jgi:hypothetical protein